MHAEHDPELSVEQRRQAATLRQQLDDSTTQLDAVSVARLAAARRRALDAARPRRAAAPWWAGVAVAASLLAALLLRPDAPSTTPGIDAEGLEWLAMVDGNPEAYEDLELYEALAHDHTADTQTREHNS
ncbi:MAG TPA: hypothetical protein VGE57_11615 [Solimonas sp.]